MQEDIRCCGTGTCLINADGLCWCGQHWDGQKMCFAAKAASNVPTKLAESVASNASPAEAPKSDGQP